MCRGYDVFFSFSNYSPSIYIYLFDQIVIFDTEVCSD